MKLDPAWTAGAWVQSNHFWVEWKKFSIATCIPCVLWINQNRLDRVTIEDVQKRLEVAPTEKKKWEARLRWYGHVMRTALRLDPGGHRLRGRPKKQWMDAVTEDMRAVDVAPEDTQDRFQM